MEEEESRAGDETDLRAYVQTLETVMPYLYLGRIFTAMDDD